MNKKAVIIGAGIGGLALGIRLQSLGVDTTVVEKLDAPGGRAYVRKAQGFTFDMGPTVITVPHFIDELFALERGAHHLDAPDFPPAVMPSSRPASPAAGDTSQVAGMPDSLTGEACSGAGTLRPKCTADYIRIVPLEPFYRIFFADGTFFDYDGDPEHTRAQISHIAPDDLAGYERFQRDAQAIFERGFLKLGYTYFGSIGQMLAVASDLMRLDAVRTLFGFTSKYFRSQKLRQVFSFEPLLIGGNPLAVPAIYAMIHFVERTWGIHFAMGGTGALVNALVRKFEALGGTLQTHSEVKRIVITDPNGHAPTRYGRRIARGVELASGVKLDADLVVSNGDYAHTYQRLIDPTYRLFNTDARVRRMRQSMSLVVIYFGFRADRHEAERLRHHNIILGPRYEGLLTDIFDRHILPADFAQYLHLPTLTDPSLAPADHHAAYTLIPVPNKGASGAQIDWSVEGPKLTDTVLRFLDEAGYIPGLRQRLVYTSVITPDYFEHDLNSALGNAFGPEPTLTQSAYFRPHNRSEDIERLYLVGASTQPGGGTPSVMMSAKMTARLIAQDFGICNQV